MMLLYVNLNIYLLDLLPAFCLSRENLLNILLGCTIKGARMLSDETKKTIDALSKDELRQEINKGNRSRFQGDKFAYLQTRQAAIEEQEQHEIRREDVTHKTEEITLAREANNLSHKANKLSRIAIVVSVLAALIALGALAFDIWLGGKSSAP